MNRLLVSVCGWGLFCSHDIRALQAEVAALHDTVQRLSEEVQAKSKAVSQLESAKESMLAVASQHTAAADANEEDIAALKGALEANDVRMERLRKQRQEMEVW